MNLPKEEALAVAVFDSQEKVVQTLSKMKLRVSCAMDDGLVKELGVKVVPAERHLTLEDRIGRSDFLPK